MLLRTQQVLEELALAAWFSRVGQPTEAPNKRIKSWAKAIDLFIGDKHAKVHNTAHNELLDVLNKEIEVYKSPDYNRLVDEIKGFTIPVVERKLASLRKSVDFPEAFGHQLHWDIVLIGIAADYFHIYPSAFYIKLAYWYYQGHLPCGWQGWYPRGDFFIF